MGFEASADKTSYVLAALVQGRFDSYFTGKSSPLLQKEEKGANRKEEKGETEKQVIDAVIEKSPESSRIILFASNAFLQDSTLQLSQVGGTRQFLNSLQLIENAVDWSTADDALSSLRGRGQFSRTLRPMHKQTKKFWEYTNYAIAFVALCVVYFAILRARKTARYKLAQMM